MNKGLSKEFESLMKHSLDTKNNPGKRADAFHNIYNKYVESNGNDTGWDKFRIKLRDKFSNKLTLNQKKGSPLKGNHCVNHSLKLKIVFQNLKKALFPWNCSMRLVIL